MLALSPALVSPAMAAKPEVDKLSPTVVRDLHFGDALFYYYQGQDFEAITRLQAYRQWGRMPHHDAETDLLLGGLYLSLGLHNEAGERFETLLTQSVPEGVRNRAWFYLGKVWYARGYLDRAERAIKEVQGRLTPDLEAERLHLLSNILMRQQRFDEAIALLNNWKGRKDQSDWLAYAQYNLGVALVRKGLVTEADPFLTAVGTIESGRRELRSPEGPRQPRAGLRLSAEQPAGARQARAAARPSRRPVLEQGAARRGLGGRRARPVPGGAHAVDGTARSQPARFRRAGSLSRDSLCLRQAQRQRAGRRELRAGDPVVRHRDREHRRVHRPRSTTAPCSTSCCSATPTTSTAGSGSSGNCRTRPQSRYLYHLLAGHDFQEGLKNYRDLAFLGGTLARWQDSIVAFDDMLDTRERAYAERVPQADAVLASGRLDKYGADRATAGGQLDQVEAAQDVAALGTAEERDQWARIVRLEAALLTAPNDEETNAIREKTRLAKGVLVLAARRVLQGARVERAPHAEGSRPGVARSAEPLGARAEGARLHA